MKKIILWLAVIFILVGFVAFTLVREHKLPLMILDADWYKSRLVITTKTNSTEAKQIQTTADLKPIEANKDVQLSFCDLKCAKEDNLCQTVKSFLPCQTQASDSGLNFDLFGDKLANPLTQVTLNLTVDEPSLGTCYMPLYKKGTIHFKATMQTQLQGALKKYNLDGQIDATVTGFCSCYTYKKIISEAIAHGIMDETKRVVR